MLSMGMPLGQAVVQAPVLVLPPKGRRSAAIVRFVCCRRVFGAVEREGRG
jgi:hypothetical protein